MAKERLEHYTDVVASTNDLEQTGKVTQIIGLTIESKGPAANVGDLCYVTPRQGRPIHAEVVGFREQRLLLMPLADLTGIGPGSLVTSLGKPLRIRMSQSLLGRVLDGLGRPIDGRGPVGSGPLRSVVGQVVAPLSRKRIDEPLSVGVKAIDGILTCGRGQRLGVFAGSGVGKSTLLGMMARNTEADINVIALVGERGREVRDFLERDLGEEGLARSVVIAATSDEPALVRLRAAMVATAVAEFFRDCGQDVLFMMDSVTRFAAAQREIGLAIGEPPATRGYTPSVFALLPKLLERTGPGDRGTITAFYTVLVDGDDMNEPIADAVRGILDGHIVLSRQLAERQHYPAIDILQSVSRVMPEVTSADHQRAAGQLRSLLAVYRDAEDLINIGAYVEGSNPRIDRSVGLIDSIETFLTQSVDESPVLKATINQLMETLTTG